MELIVIQDKSACCSHMHKVRLCSLISTDPKGGTDGDIGQTIIIAVCHGTGFSRINKKLVIARLLVEKLKAKA